VFDTYVSCLLQGCPDGMKSDVEPMMKQMKGTNPLFSTCSSSPSGGNSGGSSGAQVCDFGAIDRKGAECGQAVPSDMAGGDICGVWSTFECCVKDAFSSCDASVQSKIAKGITQNSQSMTQEMPELASCEVPMCSSEAGEVLMTSIIIAPAKFSLKDYIAAVKKTLGSTHVKATLKYFKILVSYLVPEGAALDKIKQALKTANNVTDSEVEVSFPSRRLGDDRRMASSQIQVAATFKVTTKEKAVGVTTSAESASTSQLEADLGGAATVASTPVTSVEVETQVRVSKERKDDLSTAIEGAGKDIGGTISATKKVPTQVPKDNLSGSVFLSLRGVAVAACMIFITTM
jgi:hypothetical protein